MKVKKSDGSYEQYSADKVKSGVYAAYNKTKQEYNEETGDTIVSKLNLHEGIGTDEIRAQVEELLMDINKKVAKAYIKYGENEAFIKDREKYMEEYANCEENAATLSETDPNANQGMKNVASLEGEVYKTQNRNTQRKRMKDKLKVLYPEVADTYKADLEDSIIYAHDEASTPALKYYTYSPFEVVEVKYGDQHLLTSIKSLYDLIPLKETLVDPDEEVYSKFPTNLTIKDRSGETKITRLTRKARHRDLVRVKTSFGEDLIVTDNHPLIIGDTEDITINAKDSLNEKQLCLDNKISFEGIDIIDLSQILECDLVRSNHIATHETGSPYFYSKRFIKMDRSLGYVVGFFIGDGNYDNTYGVINFSQKETDILEHLSEMLFESFGVITRPGNVNPNSGVSEYVVCSRIVTSFFRDFLKIKDKAENKCLPYNILEFTPEFAKGIVEGLIDSDGTIQNKDSSISIRLSSRECIMQLTKLLRYFGYGVANTHQSTPFNNNTNTKIQTNYDIWGVVFSNASDVIPFDESVKWKTSINRCIDKGLKYKTGWRTITSVDSITDGSFLKKCDYIYDITTESHTFDCNNLWVHNCQAVSLYPLMSGGVGNIDGVTPSAPNDLQSFGGQVTNLDFLLSAQCKGAVALGEYQIALILYIRKEYGTDWLEHVDEQINRIGLKKKTIRTEIKKCVKQFIYGINQPASNRNNNSPFTNISIYDHTYYDALFKDFYYPDGTQCTWEEVDYVQRLILELRRELNLIKPLTFPVTTIAVVNDGKDIIDKDYKLLCAEEWSKGSSHFCYNSNNPSSLASCCRVLNEITENTFSSINGLQGIMTGSCNVITINLNRITQKFIREKHPELLNESGTVSDHLLTETEKVEYKEYLTTILERVYKYHIAYKTMLYDMEDKKMFASSNGGYIYMKKLYSTVGLIGYQEAAIFLGLNISKNNDYIDFLQLILSTVKEQNKIHSIRDKKYPFLFNSEAIPGENLAVKFYQKDKKDGFFVPKDRNLFASYFFNPWDDKISVLDKMYLHGKCTSAFADGGQACHINLMEDLSVEQYLKMIDYSTKEGTNYWTINRPISVCADCGCVVDGPADVCPKCGSKEMDWWTRIIGYLRPLSSFSKERFKEAKKRIYSGKDCIEIDTKE